MAKLMRPGEVTLITGGARSGKSRLAEAIIAHENQAAIYVATAEVRDDEMATRVTEHQDRRGPNWQTEEIPFELVTGLTVLSKSGTPILVDCLTLWLTNILLAERDIEFEIKALADYLKESRTAVVLVSNETGLGIVPDNALARRFRDHAGIMNQRIAEVADNVLFVAAGLPLVLKGRNPAPLNNEYLNK
ncbi:MAG: bifunctional adenosylcobinamide kinase/adenosylcobinamide-phosphate guanylyltransferase [Alphaproteobacteria bacterium]|jgi:adenosylcobinamide kinase / adenosylcobinamide-phosphate guanylyltransferase|nr:bifunctional adenosylcobinamide kinase/adenosylcobinamide-phosphate guanylyltransferase [Alphaproteobacteria bacterium]MBT4965023.1 bifunctional adenosylcobinamide kinase/adenosylcobinamide-phosphate guanylyltransferase [Alphaproteobacteria bacterium]MBT5161086.1 bifunctional adenosylcobinamide kinase/adenosylcobinamide-phosphate guanylyltransferase [Alphaproteobacteria bacterium]MBT5916897.1 bifunctional adenosylcobinamide kinase/adenosylcobinamide-phosphate guanylyltransferase [Alphaproteob